MNTPTATSVAAAPSQLALDNITETMAALVDEAMAITGTGVHHGQATLVLSRVPAAVWHDMTGRVQQSDNYTWKEISRQGLVHISAFCEHDTECPSRILQPASVNLSDEQRFPKVNW